VDEFRLLAYPQIAGKGKVLFAGAERRRGLELGNVQRLSDGVGNACLGRGRRGCHPIGRLTPTIKSVRRSEAQ
jgi:hypothetical protein